MWREYVNQVVQAHTSSVVQTGPFAGLRLSPAVCWGDGDISPKLLGCYESELHPFISESRERRYGAIIDIGCAEGFYAVGLARAFSELKVYAYDISESARLITSETAALNEISHLVDVRSFCGPHEVRSICGEHHRVLALLDCEGFEDKLLSDQSVVESLSSSDLIIECHDFVDPNITSNMFRYLNRTHFISIVYAGARNPNIYPFLAFLHDNDRWMAVSENRPCLMHWLICRSRRF